MLEVCERLSQNLRLPLSESQRQRHPGNRSVSYLSERNWRNAARSCCQCAEQSLRWRENGGPRAARAQIQTRWRARSVSISPKLTVGPEWHKIDWQAIEQVEKERVRRLHEESQPRMLGKDIDDPVTRTKGNDAGNVTDPDAMQQEKT